MSHEIRTDGPIIEMRLFATLTNDDFIAITREIDEIERRESPVRHRLTDMRDVARLDIDFREVAAFAEERRVREFPNRFKSAIVAPDPAHYGFARMFQTLNDNEKIVISIFPDDLAARAWLSIGDLDPPETPWAPKARVGR